MREIFRFMQNTENVTVYSRPIHINAESSFSSLGALPVTRAEGFVVLGYNIGVITTFACCKKSLVPKLTTHCLYHLGSNSIDTI